MRQAQVRGECLLVFSRHSSTAMKLERVGDLGVSESKGNTYRRGGKPLGPPRGAPRDPHACSGRGREACDDDDHGQALFFIGADVDDEGSG